MAQIKTYVKDTALSNNDTVIGNDSDNLDKTALFTIESISNFIINAAGDNGLGAFNIKLLEIRSDSGFTDAIDIINNSLTETVVVANEVLLVYSDEVSVKEVWMFLKGAGTYGGVSGTPVVGTDFFKIVDIYANSEDISLNVAYPDIGIPNTTGFSQTNFNDAVYSNLVSILATQSDWDETDVNSTSYIKNKPTIVSAGVQSDWAITNNQADSYIKNKPTSTASFVNGGANGSDLYTTQSQIDLKENVGVASSLVNTHTSNVSNPHNVTAAQLSLSTVASSGDYSDLLNKPTIPPNLTVRNQSLPYTLLDSDNGSVLIFTNGGALTVPSGLTGDFECGFIQGTGSAVTIAGSGVTLNNAATYQKQLNEQYSQGYVVGNSTIYYLFGDLKLV